MTGARWRTRTVDADDVERLRLGLSLRRLTAQVLVGRGFREPEAVERFLHPRLAELRPPEGVSDLARAVERIELALAGRQRIGVFGDYDVDGVTTAAVLASGLRALGGEVIARAARRSSGYGLSPEDAARFADDGCVLVITGDCGTSDHDALTLLRQRQVDSIVIDHHQVPAGPSPATALINPHRADDSFPFKGLASCGLAFYLIAALRTRLRGQGHPTAESWDPRSLLDLVALGTIADLVPLRDENRILVAAGLRELGRGVRPGLRALAEQAEVDTSQGVDTTLVSFRYAPRLNAAGRLGDAQLALDVLLAPDAATARARVLELEDKNRERQRIQEGVAEEALAAAAQDLLAEPGDPAVVVAGQGWHQGVVGIVAAKLVDRYRHPAVVVGFDGDTGRGSARTVRGIDLYRTLVACAGTLDVFGGHAAAAGLTVRQDRFAEFRLQFLATLRAAGTDAPEADEAVAVDAVVELAELDLVGIEELARLEPFGNANPQPVLAVPGLTAARPRTVGKGHLQLKLSQRGSTGDAIGFGLAGHDPGDGASIDVIGCAEMNHFRGVRQPRVRILHLHASASGGTA